MEERNSAILCYAADRAGEPFHLQPILQRLEIANFCQQLHLVVPRAHSQPFTYSGRTAAPTFAPQTTHFLAVKYEAIQIRLRVFCGSLFPFHVGGSNVNRKSTELESLRELRGATVLLQRSRGSS